MTGTFYTNIISYKPTGAPETTPKAGSKIFKFPEGACQTWGNGNR